MPTFGVSATGMLEIDLSVQCCQCATQSPTSERVRWYVYLDGNWLVMPRDSDHQMQVLMQQALVLTRLISSSEEVLEAERWWLEVLCQMQTSDRLHCLPLKARPGIDSAGVSPGRFLRGYPTDARRFLTWKGHQHGRG